jgi:hypothetical protein
MKKTILFITLLIISMMSATAIIFLTNTNGADIYNTANPPVAIHIKPNETIMLTDLVVVKRTITFDQIGRMDIYDENFTLLAQSDSTSAVNPNGFLNFGLCGGATWCNNMLFLNFSTPFRLISGRDYNMFLSGFSDNLIYARTTGNFNLGWDVYAFGGGYDGTRPPYLTINGEYPCDENWTPIYSSCTIGDNQTLIYTDTNHCGTHDNVPLDNGTTSSCNYCTLSESSHTICENSLYKTYYTNDNSASCCDLTGLPADCTLTANSTGASCYVSAHSSSDISAVIIDFFAEYGIVMIGLVSVIAIAGLYIWIKKRV